MLVTDRRNHSTHDDALEAGIWIRKDGESRRSRHDDANRSPLFPLSLWLDTIVVGRQRNDRTMGSESDVQSSLANRAKFRPSAKRKGKNIDRNNGGFPLRVRNRDFFLRIIEYPVSQLKLRVDESIISTISLRAFDMLILFRLKVTFCSFVGRATFHLPRILIFEPCIDISVSIKIFLLFRRNSISIHGYSFFFILFFFNRGIVFMPYSYFNLYDLNICNVNPILNL